MAVQTENQLETSDIDEKSIVSVRNGDPVPEERWKPILRKIDLHILPLVYLQYLIMRIVCNSAFLSFIAV
jgi:sulfur carrier protein ThiS